LDAIDEALVERDAHIASEFKKELDAQSKSRSQNKKKATAAAKKKAKSKKKTDSWDSDLEESDDDFVAAKPVPRARVAPKKTAAKKPVAKPPAAAIDETVSVLEKLSINEDKDDANPAAIAVKAIPKKAPPVKKAVPKKAQKLYDSSDEESDEFNSDSESDSEVEMISAPAPSARARSGRAAAAKKVTYVVEDSDDESFDEDSDF